MVGGGVVTDQEITVQSMEPLGALIVKPGEVLVLQCKHRLNDMEFDHLMAMLRKQMPPEVMGRVLVLDPGFDVTKIEAP